MARRITFFDKQSTAKTSAEYPWDWYQAQVVIHALDWGGATIALFERTAAGAVAVPNWSWTADTQSLLPLAHGSYFATIVGGTPTGLTFDITQPDAVTASPTAGSGGGGAGDASAANQVTQITRATSTLAQLTAGATAIPKAEDTASADGDVGIPAMAVQKAAPADLAGTDGDYAMLQMSAGRVWTSAVVTANALPTGAATEASLAAAAASLVSIDGGTPAALGQTTMSASMPVTLASNQSALPVTVAAGAATIGKAEDVASADADVGVPAMAVRKATPANTSGTDGDYEMLQMSAGRLWASVVNEASETVIGKTVGPFATIDASITRFADTVTYAANDALADSTSAPTAGGFSFTGAARLSGGSGVILDAVITSSADPALLLQGEIWVFDQAVTAINDNAAFAVSDSDVLNLVGVIPFTLADSGAATGNNSFAHVSGLNYGFTCVGTANLRFLVKVKNAYIPISGEVLKVRLKIAQQ